MNEIKGCLPKLLGNYLSGKIERAISCGPSGFLLYALSCGDDEDVMAWHSPPDGMRADSRMAEWKDSRSLGSW